MKMIESDILELSDKEFGKGFITRNDIEQSLKILYYEGGQLAGFCLSKILTPSELYEYLGITPDDAAEYIRAADKVGFIDTIIVAKEWQRQGIGRKLAEKSLRSMMNGANVFCSVGWKHSTTGAIPIDKMLQSMGFTRYKEIPDFWYKDSLSGRFVCAACDAAECRCSAVIYCMKY